MEILTVSPSGMLSGDTVTDTSNQLHASLTILPKFQCTCGRRKVFKVETVGDCYVAVTGIPEARKDHAVAMCKFARDCMTSFAKLVRKLEVNLGPDTGELNLRIGKHV